MGAVTILLGLGICVFLIWFFENIANDFATDDNSGTEYVYLHRDTECAGNRRKTEYTDLHRDTECAGNRRKTEYTNLRRENMYVNINKSENIIKKRTYAA